MLHVTNGYIVVTRLHDLGLPGRALPWDDVLHEGPVREGLDHTALRVERATFLASCGWETTDAIERHLSTRDHRLANATPEDEIVLWFEHDLYDQLQLIQILDRLDHPRITGVLPNDFLAAQPPQRLREWFQSRQPITADQRQLASMAWTAFRSPDPGGLVRMCGDDQFGRDLPYLIPALRRHLQQYPSVENGLSRSEEQTLRAVAGGATRVRDAFVAANHRAEAATFMGDTTWWWHSQTLLKGRRPLLRVEGEPPSHWADSAWWNEDESTPRLALTSDGAHVLAGDADHVALNGIDRWLGGVHLQGHARWRWDPSRRTLLTADG